MRVTGVKPAHPFFYDLARRHRLRARFVVVCRLRLDQVPAVTTEILENRHDPIGLMPWPLNEPHTGGGHARMIAVEIIRFQEQENPPSGLITDARRLGRTIRPRQ